MEASELRIGNWVSYKTLDNNDNWGVKYTQIEAEDIPRMYYSGNIYEPIPLTEERLEEFGFLKWNDEGLYIEAIPNVLRMFLYPIENSNAFAVHWDHNWITSVEYAHQLQNLFFCLTGEELEIKSE